MGMKEKPEEPSHGHEVADLYPPEPREEAEFPVTVDAIHDPDQAESRRARQAKTGEFAQAPAMISAAVGRHAVKPGIPTPTVAAELDGIAANGGAVGAVILGIWAILGSLLTYWSMINGILGLALGIWGLRSKRSRMAWIGIILSLIGALMSMVAVSEMISTYWDTAKDAYVQ